MAKFKVPKRHNVIGPESMGKLLSYGGWATHGFVDNPCCLCGRLLKRRHNTRILFYHSSMNPSNLPQETRVTISWDEREKRAYKSLAICMDCFYYFGLFSFVPSARP